jgi:hemoglobin-like flavoprotein
MPAPAMTPRQKALVRDSFALVVPVADQAATRFYERLFEADPTLRPLFAHTDMTRQRQVLVQTLAVVVAGLEKLDTIVPAVQALGRRHAGYGVRDADYEVVGAALIRTLDELLGDAFSRDVREAWIAAYHLLSGVMRDAAAELVAAEAVAADLRGRTAADPSGARPAAARPLPSEASAATRPSPSKAA